MKTGFVDTYEGGVSRFFCLLFFACCGLTSCATKSGAQAQCDTNDGAIIQAVVASEGARVKAGRVLVVYDATVRPVESRVQASDFRSGAMMSALLARNEQRLTGVVASTLGIRFVDASESSRLFSAYRSSGLSPWQQFYRVFPDAEGALNLSLPGYANDKCRALVYLELQRGDLSAEDVFVEVVLKRHKWIVVGRCIVYAS